jgi:hypothetical protein
LRSWEAATGKQHRAVPLPAFPVVLRAAWSPDGRVLARSRGCMIHLCDDAGQCLGVLLPDDPFAQLAVTPDGHHRGTARVERQIVMVVQRRDGTSETLTPAAFEQKYGWHNDPAQVRLVPDAGPAAGR